MQREDRFRHADRIIVLGFWGNAILMVLKLLAGHFGGSKAVFADGVESACDFVALGTTLFALRIGRKPFDERHPYGHGRAESIAALMVALIIVVTGAGILAGAVKAMVSGTLATPRLMAVAAAAVTILAKEWMYRASIAAGRRLESPALLAVARDHRKDALTSVATLVGVGAAYAGFPILDPLAAAVTSFFIFHIGYGTFRSATHELMDGQLPQDVVSRVISLAEGVSGVEHVHEIRGRRSGQYLIIDLKLDMDPEMTVKHSHDIATEVKRLIFTELHNVGDVMIHINPHDEEHEDLIRL
jgi:cation diffusion facilitator family transporter